MPTEEELDNVPSFMRRGRQLPTVEWERESVSEPREVRLPTPPQTLLSLEFHWMEEFPTKTGWWWNRFTPGEDPPVATCVFIFEGGPEGGAPGHFYMLSPNGKGYRDVRTFSGQQWAGPIPEPV